MYDESFMQTAYEEAFHGVNHNHGGPFGAVIVVDGKIIGRGHNRVLESKDPTAHAEINAIRDASQNLQHFHLEGSEIYTTCEPCPMCMSAIYWAKIEKVYYCLDRFDAEKIGFGDNHIYKELSKTPTQRMIEFKQVENVNVQSLVGVWQNKNDRLIY